MSLGHVFNPGSQTTARNGNPVLFTLLTLTRDVLHALGVILPHAHSWRIGDDSAEPCCREGVVRGESFSWQVGSLEGVTRKNDRIIRLRGRSARPYTNMTQYWNSSCACANQSSWRCPSCASRGHANPVLPFDPLPGQLARLRGRPWGAVLHPLHTHSSRSHRDLPANCPAPRWHPRLCRALCDMCQVPDFGSICTCYK